MEKDIILYSLSKSHCVKVKNDLKSISSLVIIFFLLFGVGIRIIKGERRGREGGEGGGGGGGGQVKLCLGS